MGLVSLVFVVFVLVHLVLVMLVLVVLVLVVLLAMMFTRMSVMVVVAMVVTGVSCHYNRAARMTGNGNCARVASHDHLRTRRHSHRMALGRVTLRGNTTRRIALLRRIRHAAHVDYAAQEGQNRHQQ